MNRTQYTTQYAIVAITIAAVMTEWSRHLPILPVEDYSIPTQLAQEKKSPEIKIPGKQGKPFLSIKGPQARPAPMKKSVHRENEIDRLGASIIQAGDELVADAKRPLTEQDLIELLGIPRNKLAIIHRKEKILERRLAAADRNGARGFKRLLINDHSAWMKQYVGADKYEHYREIHDIPSLH